MQFFFLISLIYNNEDLLSYLIYDLIKDCYALIADNLIKPPYSRIAVIAVITKTLPGDIMFISINYLTRRKETNLSKWFLLLF